MLGYIRPLKGEMRVREYEAFKSVYCGLCHALGKRCGFFSRFILNFEFAFLAMLLSGTETICFCRRRCVMSPFRKKPCAEGGASMELAAGYSVILCWWKLRDTICDEGFFASLGARAACLLLSAAYRRARGARPEFDALVRSRLDELKQLESESCDSIDRASDKFALILCACADSVMENGRRRALQQLLYHAGRIVYILDAVDDLAGDIERGAFNPVAVRFGLDSGKISEGGMERLRTTLRHSQNLMISAFQLLPEGCFTEIMGNIVYEGIPWVTDMVLSGRWKGRSKIYKCPRSPEVRAKE